MEPIWVKVRVQQQHKPKKMYKLMEMLSTELGKVKKNIEIN